MRGHSIESIIVLMHVFIVSGAVQFVLYLSEDSLSIIIIGIYLWLGTMTCSHVSWTSEDAYSQHTHHKCKHTCHCVQTLLLTHIKLHTST